MRIWITRIAIAITTLALLVAVRSTPAAAALDAFCQFEKGLTSQPITKVQTYYFGVPAWKITFSNPPGGSQGFQQAVLGYKAGCQIGRARLAVDEDGDLSVYDEYYVRRWAVSWTRPNVIGNGFRAIFQNDGNFVLYNGNLLSPTALWASDTWCNCVRSLAVQADGNVVIYQGNTAIWATNTAHAPS